MSPDVWLPTLAQVGDVPQGVEPITQTVRSPQPQADTGRDRHQEQREVASLLLQTELADTGQGHFVDEGSHVGELGGSFLKYLKVSPGQDHESFLPGAEDLVLLYPHQTFLHDVSVFLLKTQLRLQEVHLSDSSGLEDILRTAESHGDPAPAPRHGAVVATLSLGVKFIVEAVVFSVFGETKLERFNKVVGEGRLGEIQYLYISERRLRW